MSGASKAVLEHLEGRLRRYAKPELDGAAGLVAAASPRAPLRLSDEEALFTAVWNAVSRARDEHDFDPLADLEMDALEAEMAGRALVSRLHLKASA